LIPYDASGHVFRWVHLGIGISGHDTTNTTEVCVGHSVRFNHGPGKTPFFGTSGFFPPKVVVAARLMIAG
jgi:hypothetical protein